MKGEGDDGEVRLLTLISHPLCLFVQRAALQARGTIGVGNGLRSPFGTFRDFPRRVLHKPAPRCRYVLSERVARV